MIDTIKFKIDVSPDFLDNLQFHGYLLQKKDGFGLIEDIKTVDEFVVNKWGYMVRLYTMDTPYGPPHFYIEFSVSKYLFGTNVYLCGLNDLPIVINSFYTQLLKRYKKFPDPTTWDLQRVDLCYAWVFEEEKLKQTLKNLKLLRFPRKNHHLYKTTFMASGRSSTLRFYLKEPEFKKTDYKILKQINPKYADRVLQDSKNMIRWEVELRKSALKTIYRSSHFIGYKNLLSYATIYSLMLKQLSLYYVDSYLLKDRVKPRFIHNVFNIPSKFLNFEAPPAGGASSGTVTPLE